MPVIFESNDTKENKQSKQPGHKTPHKPVRPPLPPKHTQHQFVPITQPSTGKSEVTEKNFSSDDPDDKIDVRQLPHRTSMLGAYVLRPTRVTFATQGRHEQVLLFLRQHPITQLPWIIISGLLIFMPIILIPIINSIIDNTFFIPLRFGIVMLLFWYLATFAYAFVSFIMWYYNINIVTNQRVVDIDFVYLLVQEVTATRIEQIEDVTYKRAGSFATLFDYGNVFVQTAGTEVNIEFLSVPKPRQIGKIIIDLMGQAGP